MPIENSDIDCSINKWKIFVLLTITSLSLYFLAGLNADFFLIDIIEAQRVLWGFASFLMGIIMAYSIKKNIELFYGFIIFIAVNVLSIISPIIGIFLGVGYFGMSYSKLEKRKISTYHPDLNEYMAYEKNGNFIFTIRSLIGFFGRITFWIGFVLILLDAFYFTYLSGNYLLLFFEIIFLPLTYLIYPLFSGLWWLLIISLLGYWASTFIGNMEPVE